MRQLKEEVLSRQVAEILPTKKGLESLMKKRRIRLYLGIDPTGSNLHLGHTVPLRKIQQFADLGHEVILIIGTGTVLTGDPSQNARGRNRITEKEIAKNMKTWKKQASKILDFSKVKIKKNGDWLKKLRLPEIIEIASNISATQLFKRDMFQERIKRGDTVWTHETLYPLLQGYDSVYLDVDLEVGGTDQVFNMLIGRQLQQKMNKREKFVLTVPMIMGLDGKTMSKTSQNTVNLTDSPKEMFGKIMSLRDELIIEYFTMCTDVPLKEIQVMEKDIKTKKISPRDIKAKLAITIVGMYHTKTAAKKAGKEFISVFQERNLPKDIQKIKVSASATLPVILIKAKLASSKSEARRLISQGGVKINGEVVKDGKSTVKFKKGVVIQVGKRRFVQIS
ncbi:MAG: tyrosine--tRNA ligase [Patescibacteria group bacterium]|nr:tyrosine--tRNA ligase [Patescibacteria group bacterium]